MADNQDQSPKLLDRVRRTCRRHQYRLHTERAYTRWAEQFVHFHDTTHPRHLDEDDIRSFLTHLAFERNTEPRRGRESARHARGVIALARRYTQTPESRGLEERIEIPHGDRQSRGPRSTPR